MNSEEINHGGGIEGSDGSEFPMSPEEIKKLKRRCISRI